MLGSTQDVDTKFRALRAEFKVLPPEHEEYAKVTELIGDSKIQIKNIYQGKIRILQSYTLIMICRAHALTHSSLSVLDVFRLFEPQAFFRFTLFTVRRPVEQESFTFEIASKRLLFHGSNISNWVGILSRGLLPPKILGRVERTDAGMLGAGIYFAERADVSAKYSVRRVIHSVSITPAYTVSRSLLTVAAVLCLSRK